MGQTLLHWAVKKNDLEMCKLLISSTVTGDDDIKINKYTSLSSTYKNTETKGMCYKWKSDPDKPDYFNRTPLFLAV